MHELPHGDFARSVTTPSTVNANEAEATFESGVLNLVIPKAEDVRPKQIKINVI